MYFLHHVAQQRDQNIERDVKKGWIWRYIKSTEKQSHLSILQAEAAPLPPIPPGPSALKTLARAGATIQGSAQPSSSMFSISAICNMSTRFSRSDWQTFDAEQSWVRLERWSASTRGRNDRISPVESYEQAGVTCTRSGMPASHSRLLCLQEQGSSF